MGKKVKKIVLAYSGGLDTSVILRWLQENYKAEVIAYTADLGQEIDRKKIIKNAKNLGVKNIIIEDLKDVFVKDYIFPMIRGNALYEGIYLLGTSIARPLIAKRQIQIAKKFKADAVSHGSTGKGNDQVRFELAYYYFNPKIKIIAPWRDWDFSSRSDLIKYAKKNNIPVHLIKKGLRHSLWMIIYFILLQRVKFLKIPQNRLQSLFFKEQFRLRKLQISHPM